MSTSNEVVKAGLSEGIRARQVVLDQHVENLVEIGKICGQAIENGNKILLCGNGGSAHARAGSMTCMAVSAQ